ncbi:11314_t:CDS:2 [Funneliformis caledonium]|uniref:11314_t:CDS:1 n=1 Tax=Funneliformis caledonium TaxID=1117310 RepID=A0A9N8ZZH1_9GLOM|nr:11314_t:CDS:2 [Funneliformis caledonium]
MSDKVPDNLRKYVFFNFINTTKVISVIINDKFPLALTFDTSFTLEFFTLECFRNQFSNPDEGFCIYDNMSFIDPHGKILHVDESRIGLNNILIEGRFLKIEKPLDYPDAKFIINKFCLECGLKISKYGPTQSVVKTCKNSHEKLCLKNLIGGVKAALPWSPLSAGLSIGISALHDRKNQTYHEKSSTVCDENCVKLIGIIDKKEIMPIKEFQESVKEALKRENPLLELKKLTEQYGEYIILEMKIGGKGQKITNNELTDNAQQKSNTSSVSMQLDNKFGEINIEPLYGQEINKTSYLHTILTSCTAIGEDKIKYERGDVQEWKDSLVDFTKWEIIEHVVIEPIFNILDEDLRKKVIKIIVEQKILYRNKKSIDIEYSFNSGPYKHELIIPSVLQSNLKNSQIFASVSEQNQVFSV